VAARGALNAASARTELARGSASRRVQAGWVAAGVQHQTGGLLLLLLLLLLLPGR
jgi:hypothetical protein